MNDLIKYLNNRVLDISIRLENIKKLDKKHEKHLNLEYIEEQKRVLKICEYMLEKIRNGEI